MIRSQALKLPVGDVPDWELDGSDSEPSDLKSPAESFVILQSLKQSREKWLRAMFPKFSSRGRGGKQPDVVPPPHTIYNRGRSTLQIGPHLFMDTTVFEVHYRPFPVAVTQPTTSVYQSTPGNPLSQAIHQPQTQPSPLSASAGESKTLLSSLSVPSGLISQVNAAATSNPTLANQLQLAASGRATPEQLKTLGLLIQSLASSPASNIPTTTPQQSTPGTDSSSTPIPAAPATTQQLQYQPAIKDFDIVIEFRETPSDRWVFPRGPAIYEFVSVSREPGSTGDLTVSTIVPFPGITPPQDSFASEISAPTDSPSQQVVEFHFKMANSYICDTFSRWVGPMDKMEENRKILTEIVKPPEQKFLAYRLPEGSQLSQIQNAALPSYAMKPIKPSTENGRPKRRPAPRKSAQDPPGSPTTKRKRQAQPKSQVLPPKIACFACGQANVPLIMGGRYCRPCVEGGRTGENTQAGEASVSNELSTDESMQPPPKSVNFEPSQSPASPADKAFGKGEPSKGNDL